MGYDWGISPGPGRWARARNNYLNKPESAGAKLYRSRLERAAAVLTTGSYWETVYRWSRNQGPRHSPDFKTEYYTCGSVCTLLQLCLVEPSLNAEVTARQWPDYAFLVERFAKQSWYLQNDWYFVEGSTYPERTARCQVCGIHIGNAGPTGWPEVDVKADVAQLPIDDIRKWIAVEEEPPAQVSAPLGEDMPDIVVAAPPPPPALKTWVIDGNGNLFEPGELHVVRVTDREDVLLHSAPTNVRILFARDYGERVEVD